MRRKRYTFGVLAQPIQNRRDTETLRSWIDVRLQGFLTTRLRQAAQLPDARVKDRQQALPNCKISLLNSGRCGVDNQAGERATD